VAAHRPRAHEGSNPWRIARAFARDADEALALGLERDGIAPFVDAWERMPVLAGVVSKQRAGIGPVF